MTDNKAVTQDDISDLIKEIREMKQAIEKQNELIGSCIHRPDGQAPRLMIGMYGVLETVSL